MLVTGFKLAAKIHAPVRASHSPEPAGPRAGEVAVPSVSARVVAWFVIVACTSAPAVAAPTIGSAPSPGVLAEAIAARKAHRGSIGKRSVYAIVDYDVSWQDKRLWILDAATNAVLLRAHVRHAAASDEASTGRAVACSNVAGSLKSSPGAFVTDRAFYVGHYGRSLRIQGLDDGVNDNAAARDIVFHPAGPYTFSAGCFMVPDDEAQAALDLLVGGVFVFAHGCRGGEGSVRSASRFE